MKCKNCGNLIDNNNNFCPKCGGKIMENDLNSAKTDKVGYTALSLIAVICYPLAVLFSIISSQTLFVFLVFGILLGLTSLILSILSKAKYGDKLASVLITVNVVTVVVALTLLFLFAIFMFGMGFLSEFLSGCRG